MCIILREAGPGEGEGDGGCGAFTYTAAVEVTRLDNVPEGMRAHRIAPHAYAVFTHKVTSPDIPSDIRKTPRYIWATWLPQSGYEHAAAPELELYDERFDPMTPAGEFDIYIPVIKNQAP